jgi:hypothetical protein
MYEVSKSLLENKFDFEQPVSTYRHIIVVPPKPVSDKHRGHLRYC